MHINTGQTICPSQPQNVNYMAQIKRGIPVRKKPGGLLGAGRTISNLGRAASTLGRAVTGLGTAQKAFKDLFK